MSRANALLAFVVALLVSSSVRAELWSVRLGFPVGRRVVILDAREMGIAWEMNVAAEQLLEGGHVTSASAVATGPWFHSVAAWSRAHPQYDVGLSIALTNPYPALRWRLMTSELGPTSLVNADGYPWQSVVQLAVNADVEDVRRELDSQLLMARSAGLSPSHISGYYGTPFCRQDLAAVFLAAAQKYWIPAPVVDLTPELIDRFQRQGFPIDESTKQLIANYPLPKLDDLQLFPMAASYEQTRDAFCELLTVLPPGLTQIVCRPAVESEGMKRLTPEWQQRAWTAQALADEKVRDTIASQQIIFTNWRELMQRFEQGPPVQEAPQDESPQAHGKASE
jgi:hypothetical protein